MTRVKFSPADNEDSNENVQMHRLIRVLDGRMFARTFSHIAAVIAMLLRTLEKTCRMVSLGFCWPWWLS